MATRKRSFIVFFKGLYGDDVFEGYEGKQTNGGFISWQAFVVEMVEDRGYDDLFITNIIEVTASDYEDWIN